MGVLGTGLYSGDFAMDLRATIRAVARLPFPPDRLVEILRETERGAADNPADEEHTTFWLILADQFAKRGIDSPDVRRRALVIIDEGHDIAMKTGLGLQGAGLRTRQQVLDDLRARIVAPVTAIERPVLARPQPFMFETGAVVIYPTSRGRPVNPYFPTRAHDKGWQHDGWGAMVIIDRGRAFDFLAWYRPLVLAHAVPEIPTIDVLRDGVRWKLQLPGVCPSSHAKKMELQTIALLRIDPDRVARVFPGLKPGRSAAINEISIANAMRGAPAVPGIDPPAQPASTFGQPQPPWIALDAIVDPATVLPT